METVGKALEEQTDTVDLEVTALNCAEVVQGAKVAYESVSAR